jgi:hypothetical protein
MIELLQRCDVVCILEILARFRLHNRSKTVSYGSLQFRLERVKKLRTMPNFQRYISSKELIQEQVSVLLTLANLEKDKAQYISAWRLYAKALAVSPFLTMVTLLRRSLLGQILRKTRTT